MKVSLITFTEQPELTVARAARLCYSAVGIDQLSRQMSVEDCHKLLGKIIDLGHWSALEHASFTFAVEGVSRALSHQLVRHRLASYSQQSQRYVAADQPTVVVPPTIEAQPEALVVFRQLVEAAASAYRKLTELGIPREDARYVLPNAAETKLVMTMNARELRHFFRLRCCRRAQWEIRHLAETILGLVQAVAPRLFAGAGAECQTTGFCPEGELSCGLAPVRQ
ncbi:MAG: FAD-dependent thymidylate synthase [Negativicutes bacterium]|nr:FAD-dependent thymidylate synthase [Negativicutes bacterium]